MLRRVYLETSVIGAYFDKRTDSVSASQKIWTCSWWNTTRNKYEVVVSQAVIYELKHQNFPHSQKALKLIENIPELEVENEIRQIVKIYIQNKIMPQNPMGDALHLAIASYYKCDYLLTWNCKHLANPNKFRQIQICNNALGLYVPILCTPNQLLGDEYD